MGSRTPDTPKERGKFLGPLKNIGSLQRCTQKRLNRSRCRLGVDSCEPKESGIRRGPDRTNPFAAARGDKIIMQPFVKILWPLVEFCRSCKEHLNKKQCLRSTSNRPAPNIAVEKTHLHKLGHCSHRSTYWHRLDAVPRLQLAGGVFPIYFLTSTAHWVPNTLNLLAFPNRLTTKLLNTMSRVVSPADKAASTSYAVTQHVPTRSGRPNAPHIASRDRIGRHGAS